MFHYSKASGSTGNISAVNALKTVNQIHVKLHLDSKLIKYVNPDPEAGATVANADVLRRGGAAEAGYEPTAWAFPNGGSRIKSRVINTDNCKAASFVRDVVHVWAMRGDTAGLCLANKEL